MKHLRVTAGVDGDDAPAFGGLLATVPQVNESRLVDWNLTAEEAMLLFAIDGDPAVLRSASAEELPGVRKLEVVASGPASAQALVTADRETVPLFSCLASALADGGLMVRKPVVFRDGDISTRVVGDAGPLQEALERENDAIRVQIDEISSEPDALDRPAASLSERQREALDVALSLGYYDQPRGATHEDVAAELDCAPQTASDHLQKAEAKLVRAGMDEFGPQV